MGEVTLRARLTPAAARELALTAGTRAVAVVKTSAIHTWAEPGGQVSRSEPQASEDHRATAVSRCPPYLPGMGEAVGDVVELRIDALAAGGDGVGRTAEGRVVFVPRTAPGDRVKARIAALHPRYARAELEADPRAVARARRSRRVRCSASAVAAAGSTSTTRCSARRSVRSPRTRCAASAS